MASVIDIEGIGPVYTQKLKAVGVDTVEELLNAAASAEGRQALAEKTGISRKRILSWANRADLWRIKGVGEEYTDLLEMAGVDTVPELAQRNPENLYQALMDLQAQNKLVRKMPVLSQVQDWVAQAKGLPRVMTY